MTKTSWLDRPRSKSLHQCKLTAAVRTARSTDPGGQRTLTAPCVGRDGLRAELQSYRGARVQATIVGTTQVTGGTVRARVEASADPYRAVGIERIVNTVTAEVRGGLITSFTGVPDASGPQTARFLALQGGPQPQPGQPSLALPRTGLAASAVPPVLGAALSIGAGLLAHRRHGRRAGKGRTA